MIIHGDAIQIPLADNCVDTCITDPPYHLTSITKRFGKENSAPAKYGTDGVYARASAGFMGKTWDGGDVAFNPATWTEVYRVLKPGALLLAFGGTRTYHRMVCAIEDSGFEIRDTIAWVYGSGFPKSYDISKGIDKQAGAEREVGYKPIAYPDSDCWGVPNHNKPGNNWGIVGADDKGKGKGQGVNGIMPYSLPSTPEAQLWHGWGTALKPAFEPIVLAMKPIDGTFVNNALTWGVAGMNIDGGRVGTDEMQINTYFGRGPFGDSQVGNDYDSKITRGRYPANFIHDGSDEVMELFPQTGKSTGGRIGNKGSALNMMGTNYEAGDPGYGDSGSAARFLLRESQPKRAQRWAGGTNHHPTIKPIELMRYLVRLTKTPTGGVVLDPFTGSGTTGCACVLEGREFIGIGKEAEYIEIAEKRIAYWSKQPKLPVE